MNNPHYSSLAMTSFFSGLMSSGSNGEEETFLNASEDNSAGVPTRREKSKWIEATAVQRASSRSRRFSTAQHPRDESARPSQMSRRVYTDPTSSGLPVPTHGLGVLYVSLRLGTEAAP